MRVSVLLQICFGLAMEQLYLDHCWHIGQVDMSLDQCGKVILNPVFKVL